MGGEQEAAGEVQTSGPIFCPSCNKNTWPWQKPAEGEDKEGNSNGGMRGMVDVCSACNSVLGRHDRATQAAPARMSGQVPAVTIPLTVESLPINGPALPAQPWPMPAAPSDFMGQAAARLEAIEVELARLEGLKAEAKALRRMLGKKTR